MIWTHSLNTSWKSSNNIPPATLAKFLQKRLLIFQVVVLLPWVWTNELKFCLNVKSYIRTQMRTPFQGSGFSSIPFSLVQVTGQQWSLLKAKLTRSIISSSCEFCIKKYSHVLSPWDWQNSFVCCHMVVLLFKSSIQSAALVSGWYCYRFWFNYFVSIFGIYVFILKF